MGADDCLFVLYDYESGRAVHLGQLARSKSAEVRVASGDLKRPQAF